MCSWAATGKDNRKDKGGEKDPVIYHVYEAENGFRGSYDECMEQEERCGVGLATTDPAKNEVLFIIFECEDGFRGSLEECEEHEKLFHLGGSSVGTYDPALLIPDRPI